MTLARNSAPKIHGQAPSHRMTSPRLGAMTGTTMKIIMTKDITRAISRPRKRSRTMAMATTRGAAAPRPCNARAASSVVKLGAKAAPSDPMAKMTSPTARIGLRPNRSDSGPWKGWPAARPSM